MKLTIGSIISVSIRYIYLRDNSYYYQRKIPLDLLERYDGLKLIKLNLKTLDITDLPDKVRALNKHYESLWGSMRNNSSLMPTSVREEATALLNLYGLKPLPYQNNQDNIDHFIDLVIDPKREVYADGDDSTYRTASPSEYLSAKEAEALRILRTAPKLNLSESLNIYLKGHQKGSDEKFKTYTKRVWDKLIEILGDIPFESVTRASANEFVEKLLATGNKTTTVSRAINVVRAVFNVVLVEKEINKSNPFLKLRIAGLGNDSTERHPFNNSELTTLSKACLDKDDDLRWLVALQMDLGCRLGEVAGLALDDIKLDAKTPYVSFKPHPWRSLKTKGSARNIPLVGMSLWAANRIIANSTKGQLMAFPRYTDSESCRATAASQTLNGWFKGQSIGTTTHGFRHAMRDRLRDVNAPSNIQDAVGGWGKQDIGDNYGHGYALETLKEWLDKVVIDKQPII